MIYAIIAVFVVLVLWAIMTYNKLVKLRNRVEDQGAQIDVQLKKRFDLIPNVVETVKGYAKHEKEALNEVIEARSKALNAGSISAEMEANNQLTGALNKLFALSESYPELKANTNFIELQKTLKEVEDKIAYNRQFYNDTVLKYKDAKEVFPTVLIASMLGFKNIPFLEASEQERENVRVQF